MWTVALVPLIVWIGVIVYLFTLDRKLTAAESREKEQDDL